MAAVAKHVEDTGLALDNHATRSDRRRRGPGSSAHIFLQSSLCCFCRYECYPQCADAQLAIDLAALRQL